MGCVVVLLCGCLRVCPGVCTYGRSRSRTNVCTQVCLRAEGFKV